MYRSLSFLNYAVAVDTPILAHLISRILNNADAPLIGQTQWRSDDAPITEWCNDGFAVDTTRFSHLRFMNVDNLSVIHGLQLNPMVDCLKVGGRTAELIATRLAALTDLFEWSIASVGLLEEGCECFTLATGNRRISRALEDAFPMKESIAPYWNRIYGGLSTPCFRHISGDTPLRKAIEAAVLSFRNREGINSSAASGVLWQKLWSRLENAGCCMGVLPAKMMSDAELQDVRPFKVHGMEYVVGKLGGSRALERVFTRLQDQRVCILPNGTDEETACQILYDCFWRAFWYDRAALTDVEWMLSGGSTPCDTAQLVATNNDLLNTVINEWSGDIYMYY